MEQNYGMGEHYAHHRPDLCEAGCLFPPVHQRIPSMMDLGLISYPGNHFAKMNDP